MQTIIENLPYIIYGAIFVVLVFFVTIFVFDLLLRGFAPFIPSRPWVIEQILNSIDIPQAHPRLIAFSTGRSGVIHALEKKYPEAQITGVESELFPYIVAKVQSWLRPTKIKVVRQAINHTDLKDADFVYCHLDPDGLRFLSAKFKFDCRPGTQVVSTGFNIPYLEPKKVIDLPDRKGRMNRLSKNQKLFPIQTEKIPEGK